MSESTAPSPPAASCPRHAGSPVAGPCAACGRSYCAACLETRNGRALCEPCRLGGPGAPRKGSPALFVAAVVGSLATVAALLALVALPNLQRARKRANERSAVRALDAIVLAEAELARIGSETRGKAAFGSLEELSKAGALPDDVASGQRAGYRFEARPSTDGPERLWWAAARPLVPGKTGDRVYYVNQEGVVFQAPWAGGEHDPGLPDPRTCALPSGLAPVRLTHH